MDAARVETRISLVLYGGVSLAVYISGSCQELLSLVRATADPDKVPDDQLTRPERIYRELARTAGPGDTPMRVTVDVLSGSSAGGLNAVFLAKALSRGGDLAALTEIWRKDADFLRLLNEEAESPRSLLSGDLFYELLLGALDGMPENASRTDGLVPAVDCYLTTTDLRGVAESVHLHRASIQELRRRARFHFRDGIADALGENEHDLGRGNNAVLAFAARATAAHPAAFHPANWLDLKPLTGDRASRRPELHKYLSPAHGPEGSLDEEGIDLQDRWYSDGGAMDNKPFAYALEPLTARRATIPVERRVVYVEPDPSRTSGEWRTRGLPPLGDYTYKTYGLARTENIREDIAALNARNEEIARLDDALRILFERTDAEVADALRARLPDPAPPGLTDVADVARYVLEGGYERDDSSSGVVGGWATTPRSHFAAERGWGAVVQEDYRWSTVVTELIAALLQVGEVPADPSLVRRLSPSVRRRVLEWIEQRDEAPPNPIRRGLVEFDVGYRLRRFTLLEHLLSYEQRRLDLPPPEDERDVASAPSDAERTRRFDQMTAVRSALNEHYLELARFVEEQRRTDFELGDQEMRDGMPIEDWIDGEGFLTLVERVSDELDAPLRRASEDGRQVITGPDIDDSLLIRLADAWINYGDYDQLILPLASVASAELDAADVIRISPLDATGLVAEGQDGETGPRKLGGNALAHFGGFLDENWRLNDILWGRLDTAEIVTKQILGGDDDDVRRVHRAHLEDLVAAIREDPGAASPLDALLEVNHDQMTDRHRAARNALSRLRSPKDGTPLGDPVETLLTLLAPPTESSMTGRWSVDLSMEGERGNTKIDLAERAAKVLGATLARRPERSPTGRGGSAGSKRSLALVGRTVSWVVRGALPTIQARILIGLISAVAVTGGLVGMVALFAGSGDSPRAAGLVVAAVVGGGVGLFFALRRVTPLPKPVVGVLWLVMAALLTVAFVVDWRVAAAALCFLTVLGFGSLFWFAMSKLGDTIVELGNPKDEKRADEKQNAGETTPEGVVTT
ncbi:MAG: patatin-like protein [Actinomycetota bacterium]